MSDRELKKEISTNPIELILARKNANMVNPSLDVDGMGNIVPRSVNNGAEYSVTVRKSTNSGDRPRNAKSLKACKGLKGCEFAECAEKVFGVGKLPRNLERLCTSSITSV